MTKFEKIRLKLTRLDGRIQQYTTNTKSRRIYHILSHDKFLKAHIYVSYGKKECNLGCICEFYNSGVYNNSKEAKEALRMFLE